VAIQSPLDLLMYELRVLQSVEQSKLQMVARLKQICSNPQVSQLFETEIPKVQQQTLRVQECLRLLNSQPASATSHAIDCMQHDLQEFMQQNPSQQAVDMYCLGMAMKVAHYEVASYIGLVEKARADWTHPGGVPSGGQHERREVLGLANRTTEPPGHRTDSPEQPVAWVSSANYRLARGERVFSVAGG